MSSDDPPLAATNQRIELWKIAVGTQQHFNTLQLQLRNFALTLFLAILTVAGYAIKQHDRVAFSGLTMSTASFICIAGFVIVFAFYYMDWGYHQLLKGAVENGILLEAALKQTLPETGLSTAIKAASSKQRFWKIFPTDSTNRLHCFYGFLFLALFVATIFCLFVTPATAPSAVEPTTQLPTR